MLLELLNNEQYDLKTYFLLTVCDSNFYVIIFSEEKFYMVFYETSNEYVFRLDVMLLNDESNGTYHFPVIFFDLFKSWNDFEY